jgi:hypothetical protein
MNTTQVANKKYKVGAKNLRKKGAKTKKAIFVVNK